MTQPLNHFQTINWKWDIPGQLNIAFDCLDKHARHLANKNRVALYWVGQDGTEKKYTFGELSVLTNRLANALHSYGIKRGDRCLIQLGNVPEFAIAFFAVIKTGALPIAENPLLNAAELESRLVDSEAAFLITDLNCHEKNRAVINNSSVREIFIVGDPVPEGTRSFNISLFKGSPGFNVLPTRSFEPAFIAYTSSTIGTSKGALIPHRWPLANDPASLHWHSFKEDDIISTTSTINWIYPLGSSLLWAWRLGVSVLVYAGPFDPNRWFSLFSQFQITNVVSTPEHCREMHREAVSPADIASFHSIRHIVSAGELLTKHLAELWQEKFGFPLYDGFGIAECNMILTNLAGREIRPGSCGFVQPGHTVQLTDPLSGMPVPPNTPGFLCISKHDPGLFVGYWNNPEETERRFVGDWFITGDFFKVDEDGYFWSLGREDDLIVTPDGIVASFELEAIIQEHPAVLEVAIISNGNPAPKPKAFLVLEPAFQATDDLAKQILMYVEDRVDKHKIPEEIEFVEFLPKTQNQKIKRSMLRELESLRLERSLTKGLSYMDLLLSLVDTGT